MLIFDIETAPLPDEEIASLLPPIDESPFEPREFNPDDVKLGVMKDPAKITAKIEDSRKKHEKEERLKAGKKAAAIESNWLEFKSKASLSAATGRTLVVAYHNPESGVTFIDHDDSETDLLCRFWDKTVSIRAQHRKMVGLNIHDFDLPFMVRRSWILGVTVPEGTMKTWNHRIQWPEYFLDVRPYWLLGQHWGSTKSNFDTLASAFKTAGKPQEGCTGANFHEMWDAERDKAVRYATSDVEQLAVWIEKMGLS